MRLMMLFPLLATCLWAQQPNSLFASLNLDSSPGHEVPAPVVATAFTDSVITTRIRAFPGENPVVVLLSGTQTFGGALQFGALSVPGFALDLADVGAPGYADQVFADGFVNPNETSVTDVFGQLSLVGNVPSCPPGGGPCLTIPRFEFGVQAIVIDPTAPLNLRSTGAGLWRFTNGRTCINLSQLNNDGSVIYTFRAGFRFPFYGVSYTRLWVSENGYVSFTPASSGFPNPNVGEIISGAPRIMSFYTDLDVTPPSFSPDVCVTESQDADGRRKVKIVHNRIQEFGLSTGPHGGEITLADSGEIAVYVGEYGGQPTINTAVGITPGFNRDPAPQPTPFGIDLSAAYGAGVALGVGRAGFELYDHGPPSVTNPIDVIALGYDNMSPIGVGIVFIPDPLLPNTNAGNSGYVIP